MQEAPTSTEPRSYYDRAHNMTKRMLGVIAIGLTVGVAIAGSFNMLDINDADDWDAVDTLASD